MTRRALGIVALAGVVAGCLDLVYAFVYFGFRGVTPVRILQSIATGLLGRASYSGGASTALLGAVLHFFILIVAATMFYLASRRHPWLIRHAIAAGAACGLSIYGVMNFVVVPLSAFPHTGSSPPLTVITGILVHMVGVGVPIGLGARKASRLSPSTAPSAP